MTGILQVEPALFLKPKLTEGDRAGGETATIWLRIEMIRQGLTVVDMAKRVGVSRHQMQREITRGFPTWNLRHRAERVLDFPLTLWSRVEEIRFRKAWIREHGNDPRGLSFEELKTIGRRMGLRHPKRRRREDWFQLLVKHFGGKQAIRLQGNEND